MFLGQEMMVKLSMLLGQEMRIGSSRADKCEINSNKLSLKVSFSVIFDERLISKYYLLLRSMHKIILSTSKTSCR